MANKMARGAKQRLSSCRNVACALPGASDELEAMRQILETEDHVAVPPMMYADAFYRITYLVKEEIRKHKWLEGEKGRPLSWKEARAEWTEAHRKEYEKFLLDTLLFPNLVPAAEQTRQDSGASELARRSANDMRLVRHRPSHRPE
jgi:mannosyltransferase OCH1-like enzyme